MLQVEADRRPPPPADGPDDDIPDERLRLFFTCCHPALAPRRTLALTLRCLAGLTTPEVARAFLVPAATMAQRLVRAKRKIRERAHPVPRARRRRAARPAPGVLRVVYLIFTEGYAASGGRRLMRPDLADEAIRLARILHRLLPGEPRWPACSRCCCWSTPAARPASTPTATWCCSTTRTGRCWDADKIAEGRRLVVRRADGGPPGPYAVQAAIAAVHDEAPGRRATDWPQIVALYDVLCRLAPSPLVDAQPGRGRRDGGRAGGRPGAARRAGGAGELRGYHLLPAARAELLTRLGRTAEAAAAYAAALALVTNESERAQLDRRRSALVSRAARPPQTSTAQPPAGGVADPAEYARYEARTGALPANAWIRRSPQRPSGAGH